MNNGSTLALGATDQLADNADVDVQSDTTLTLAGDDTIHTLALAGTLNGPAARSAPSAMR